MVRQEVMNQQWNVVPTVAQGWNLARDDLEPVARSLWNPPRLAALHRSRSVAATMASTLRKSVYCRRAARRRATWRTRSIRAWAATGMTPISSRNCVPPSARSNLPLPSWAGLGQGPA